MGKKKIAGVSASNPAEGGVPPFFRTMLDSAQKSVGAGGAYLAGEHGSRYWGVPIPWLPMQYLLGGINILPYGQTMEIAGPPGSLKSTLAMDLIRNVCDCGGLGVYIDVESKTGPSIIESIVGSAYANNQVHVIEGVASIEGWQKVVTDRVDALRKADPDSHYPMLMVVDSLTARSTQGEQEKFEKEGQAAVRGFAIGAMAITRFVRNFPPLVFRDNGQPNLAVAFIGVNHLKDRPDGGAFEKYTPGGAGKDFQAAIRLWARSPSPTFKDLTAATLNSVLPERLRKKKVTLVGSGVRRTLYLKAQKSSLGPDRRKIEVDYYWGWDDKNIQHSWLDWDTALCRFLAENAGELPSDTVNVREEARRRFTVYIKKDKVVVSARGYEAAKHLKSAALSRLFQKVFHIRHCRQHTGNRSYQEIFSEEGDDG